MVDEEKPEVKAIVIKLDEVFKDMKVYSGTKLGENLRRSYGDDFWKNPQISIVVPEGTYTFTRNFFLGLFSPDFQVLKTKEEFLNKYIFVLPHYLQDSVMQYIEDVYRKRGPLMSIREPDADVSIQQFRFAPNPTSNNKPYFVVVFPDEQESSIKDGLFLKVDRFATNSVISVVPEFKKCSEFINEDKNFIRQLVQLTFPGKKFLFLNVEDETKVT